MRTILAFLALLLCGGFWDSSPKEPIFETCNPTRKVTQYSRCLNDIESHMPASHIYRSSDKVTHAHETTHGLNSMLRTQPGKLNSLYCLNNNYVVIKEPPMTLSQVKVPHSLRGQVYNLYVNSRSWNDRPLYLLDELSSYTNGTITGIEYNLNRGSECRYMLELLVYSVCMYQSIPKNSNYDNTTLRVFLEWYGEQVFEIYEATKNNNMNDSGAASYLNTLNTANDAKEVRLFILKTNKSH